MLFQTGQVTDIRGNPTLELSSNRASACHSCISGYGCGLGPLTGAVSAPAPYELWIDLEYRATRIVGSKWVTRSVVGLPATQLIKISSLAYVVPVVSMLIGAWLLATILLPQFGDCERRNRSGSRSRSRGGVRLVAIRNRAPVMLIDLNSEAEIIVYSRRGCHLCEVLLAELEPMVRDRAQISVRDVDHDPAWRSTYGDRVSRSFVVEWSGNLPISVGSSVLVWSKIAPGTG